ncbi:MAG: homoserine dehydrogenase [Fretibacterium sp.]|nr:homoserine dehydrogenase [Fretibacterium sp.]
MTNIAILGFGTVGGGTAQVLDVQKERLRLAAGGEIRVKYILDIRDFPGSPWEDRLVRDINVILDDPDVKVVCETMGGKEPAFTFTRAAMERGKSVCTSNKELVDAFGPELTQTAKAHSCSYLFEASVGGGIPLLRTLRDSCRHEDITSVAGILNGTCNYILTKMDREGTDFADALRQAQENGFAERNPDADILGHDTARKLAILASLISGRRVRFEQVPCQGITEVSTADLKSARARGKAVKLLGICQRNPQTGDISVMTAPCLVPADNPLYGVNDVFNGVLVHSGCVDDLMFYGRGAGKMPTASAVAADVVECVKNAGHTVENGLTDPDDTITPVPFPSALPGGIELLHGGDGSSFPRVRS